MGGVVMEADNLLKKLQLRQPERVCVVDAPSEFQDVIDALRSETQVDLQCIPDKLYDVIIAFVRAQSDVKDLALPVSKCLAEDGLLWFGYPKKSSPRYQADISRDSGWEPLSRLGYRGVRQVALDQDWSALRFRQADHVGHKA